jgi:hypothetical protein
LFWMSGIGSQNGRGVVVDVGCFLIALIGLCSSFKKVKVTLCKCSNPISWFCFSWGVYITLALFTDHPLVLSPFSKAKRRFPIVSATLWWNASSSRVSFFFFSFRFFILGLWSWDQALFFSFSS